MPDGLVITFEGVEGFNRMMTDLAGPAVERIARRAVRAGGRVVQAAITEAAPERPALPSGTALPPGALKNDIEVHVAREKDGSVSAYIEPGKLTMHVARWVEYGHRQVAGGYSRKTAEAVEGGNAIFSGPGQHVQDVPAHPFIRPAFEASELAAQDAIAMEIALAFSRGYQKIMPEDDEQLGSGTTRSLGSGE
jgi:Bacteriophage HK97-gp10, putative tail-component